MVPPRSFASRNSLPPEGAAAPAARQSRFRGPCLNGKLVPTLASFPPFFLRYRRMPPERALLALRTFILHSRPLP